MASIARAVKKSFKLALDAVRLQVDFPGVKFELEGNPHGRRIARGYRLAEGQGQ